MLGEMHYVKEPVDYCITEMSNLRAITCFRNLIVDGGYRRYSGHLRQPKSDRPGGGLVGGEAWVPGYKDCRGW